MSEYPQYPNDASSPTGQPVGGATAKGARPKSADLAVKLLWAAIALFVLGFVINIAGGSSTSQLTGAGLTEDQAAAAQGAVLVVGGLIVVILGGLFVVLTVFIGKGANWARIVTTVLTGIGVLFTLPSLFTLGSANTSVVASLLSVLDIVLCVVAVVLCFRPDSNAWFKAR